IAALMLQTNSALTPAQIYTALRSTASPMGASSPNAYSGWGFVQADMAYAAATGTGSSSGSSSSGGGGTGKGGGGGFDLLSLLVLVVLAVL
ncbi:MAG TPA: hypothetical protein VN859_05000, partial [Steroidobacteraceae bacterium]|nr:hypothetical protein [Steroidobacteraceae bacterium]